MDIPGGTPRRLTAATSPEFMPSWSPDGQWIAFVTWTQDGGQIWKIHSDGSVEIRCGTQDLGTGQRTVTVIILIALQIIVTPLLSAAVIPYFTQVRMRATSAAGMARK